MKSSKQIPNYGKSKSKNLGKTFDQLMYAISSFLCAIRLQTKSNVSRDYNTKLRSAVFNTTFK